jgi:23S rRNA pseudouridine2605 synthase
MASNRSGRPTKRPSHGPERTEVRLNKFLADCGLASRRGADGMISSGQVQVNGKTVYELGVRVTPTMDRVTVDGKPVKPPTVKIYVIFNKPENVLTTMADPEGRPTVADYMEELPVRVFPVGRLDWDTEGLLLLTNDGDFAQKVMHPREEIPKTYLAKLDGKPTQEQLSKLVRGVTIPSGKVKALFVETAKVGDSDKYGWVKIVIGEGKNRQVRFMFQKIGFDVKKLKRVAIGQLTLGSLQRGEYAFLDEGSLSRIFRKRKSDVELKRERTGPRPDRKKAKFQTKRQGRTAIGTS